MSKQILWIDGSTNLFGMLCVAWLQLGLTDHVSHRNTQGRFDTPPNWPSFRMRPSASQCVQTRASKVTTYPNKTKHKQGELGGDQITKAWPLSQTAPCFQKHHSMVETGAIVTTLDYHVTLFNADNKYMGSVHLTVHDPAHCGFILIYCSNSPGWQNLRFPWIRKQYLVNVFKLLNVLRGGKVIHSGSKACFIW